MFYWLQFTTKEELGLQKGSKYIIFSVYVYMFHDVYTCRTFAIRLKRKPHYFEIIFNTPVHLKQYRSFKFVVIFIVMDDF